MSGPYFHSESWVGKFTPGPIKLAQGASTSRLGDAEASTARESRTPVVAPSQASPQAPLPSSPSVTSPTYSPNSGPGGTPTPPGTPPTPAPGSSPGHNPGGSSPNGPPPDARAPDSHPEPPPAPIECNDPTTACTQTVQHSFDRLSGDHEMITKTIEALCSNIERLEKRCEEIIDRIRSRDHNDYARVTNGGVRDHTTSLVPLYDLGNRIPASFPRVAGDIRKLNTVCLNTLLSLYGIPIDGTIAMKKRKLALFIGLVFDIDV